MFVPILFSARTTPLPPHGQRCNWSPAEVVLLAELTGDSKTSCLAVALQLRHVLLLFQLLGVTSQDCFQLLVWLPPFTPGPAKGKDANQAIVTANLEHPTSGAPVKDAHLPPFGLFPENTSPIQ